MADDVKWEEMFTGNNHIPPRSAISTGIRRASRYLRCGGLRMHCYPLRLVRGGCVLPLIQRRKQRIRVHAISPSSPVSTTPGMRSYLPRPNALPKYHDSPPRSPSRGDAGPVPKVYFVFDFTFFVCFAATSCRTPCSS